VPSRAMVAFLKAVGESFPVVPSSCDGGFPGVVVDPRVGGEEFVFVDVRIGIIA
jgi:hypothetical protein